jgi:hypothetical protein
MASASTIKHTYRTVAAICAANDVTISEIIAEFLSKLDDENTKLKRENQLLIDQQFTTAGRSSQPATISNVATPPVAKTDVEFDDTGYEAGEPSMSADEFEAALERAKAETQP